MWVSEGGRKDGRDTGLRGRPGLEGSGSLHVIIGRNGKERHVWREGDQGCSTALSEREVHKAELPGQRGLGRRETRLSVRAMEMGDEGCGDVMTREGRQEMG